MIIRSSAPGKLILFGEHASSRNKPSIIFAINRRLHVLLESKERKDNLILISSEALAIKEEKYPSEKLDLVSETISLFLSETKNKEESFDLTITSDIPAGFGSSAAVIVSVLGVLDEFYQTGLSQEEFLDFGLKINHSVKGYGSGLDIACAIYGGLIFYQKDQFVEELPFEHLDFIVGNTGVKAPSGPIVESVREFEKSKPSKAKVIFSCIQNIVEQAKEAILNHEEEVLGELMDCNQKLLNDLDVSSKILDELIAAAKGAGAFGAKLSGAGKGDNMIALISSHKREQIAEAINKTKGIVVDDLVIEPKGLATIIEEE
ncbi:MAG: mevalonate kinase [Candidatus Heimdallarchaeota archaeon]